VSDGTAPLYTLHVVRSGGALSVEQTPPP
jgi:hypothetical protein